MKKTPRNLIYGLRDPRTNEIRYVGQSSTGLHRPKQHAKYKGPARSAKEKWVAKLLRLCLVPEIVILQVLEGPDELNSAEIFWIALGREALGLRRGRVLLH